MIGIPLGLAMFGAADWVCHRYLAPRRSHHEAVRKHGGYDPAYEGPPWRTRTQAREALALGAIAAAHLPLLPVAPFYTSTIWYCLARYRRDHRRAHLDPTWARDHLPHHYEHHLCAEGQNFGVVWSWADQLFGTRARVIGTDQERVMHAIHVAHADTARAGAALRAQRRSPLRWLARRALRSTA